MDIQELINAVREWGQDKQITGPNGKGTLLGQLSKTAEELTETRDAAVEMGWDECAKAELKDGIGDSTVTLILAADIIGLKFEGLYLAALSTLSNYEREQTILKELYRAQEILMEIRDGAVRWVEAQPYDDFIGIAEGIIKMVARLILAAELAGLKFEDCLQTAYNVIKNRKGKMIDGQFVKNREGDTDDCPDCGPTEPCIKCCKEGAL